MKAKPQSRRKSANVLTSLKIDSIQVSDDFQMRVKLDDKTIREYAQRIEENPDEAWVFDDGCTVFKIGKDLFLIDGFHRFAAMQKCEKTHVMATVRTGTRLEALTHALGANARHGLRRSNEDKRRAVRVALDQPEFAKLSNRQIGELCAVSDHLVAEVLSELRTVRSSETIGADGVSRPSSKEAKAAIEKKVIALITESPEKSNVAIAEAAGCDDKTVARIRKKLATSPAEQVSDPQEIEQEPEPTPKATAPEPAVIPAPVVIEAPKPVDTESCAAEAFAAIKRWMASGGTHCDLLKTWGSWASYFFKEVRRIEGWDETAEQCSTVRNFVASSRKHILEFEKHTTVGATAKRTLFDEDADIPGHLAEDAQFQEAWSSWWSDRKKRKLPITTVVKKKQLNLLAIGDAAQAAAICTKAEENQWKGIPDGIWIPKYGDDLWCGRMPAHASTELVAKIRESLRKNSGRNGHAKEPIDRSTFGSVKESHATMTFEEKMRAARPGAKRG